MRRPLLFGLFAGAVAIAFAITGVVFLIQSIERGRALEEHRTAVRYLTQVAAATGDAVTEAAEVAPLAGDPLLPAEPVAALEERRAATEAVLAEADAARAVDPEELPWPEVREHAAELRDLADALAAGEVDVESALDGLAAAVTASAPEVEAASFDAENGPHVAFRAAVAELGTAPDDGIGESLAAYLAAAQALAASHAEELAEKAGPLFDARMTVQAFARSLSGGVLLDFDWAPTVNGYGLGGSYGGTSYWTTADGGQATLTLSDSVAALWPYAGVQALVAHEVGHAILARQDCNALFFESDLYAGEEESWATAWAIGLGHTADGSGESIYGRPSDALIELARGCR